MAAELVEGTVCVVTGAGSGIGRASARALAAAGGRVVLIDVDSKGLEETAAGIEADGGTALVQLCDVSDEHAIAEAAHRSADCFGPAGVLVNAAGLLRSASLASLSLSEWNGLLAVNLTGFLICAQAFGAGMRAGGGGSLVHIASIGGTHATPNAGAYSVAKAGIVMLSRQLALEWAADRVRSNSVSPGLIQTGMTAAFYDRPGMTEARSAMVPQGRIGVPEDIARAVLWLASPAADYVTGQDLMVDGGLSQALLGLLPRPGFERG